MPSVMHIGSTSQDGYNAVVGFWAYSCNYAMEPVTICHFVENLLVYKQLGGVLGLLPSAMSFFLFQLAEDVNHVDLL